MLACLAVLLILPSALTQTVYLAGDSTMAEGGGNRGTQGWGHYLATLLTVPVVNSAIAGESARSYTDQGRFTALVDTVKSGDYVVIEFGHNDGRSKSGDNGRQDALGDDYTATETVTVANGTKIVIHTFPYYIQNAVVALLAKGAIPIVSSQTPDNIWSGNSISAATRFVGYAQTASARTGVTYVDHYAYTAQVYNAIGREVVNAFYPVDHTHTSPLGAKVVTAAFVRGLLCGTSGLKNKIIFEFNAFPYGCLF